MKKLFFIGCLLLTAACNLGVPAPTSDSPTLPSSPTAVIETQTVSNTETVSSTPKPPPLYFTEEFDATSPYWEFLQAGGTAVPLSSFQNGSLRFDISSPETWVIGIHTANSYSNVFVRAKTSASPTGSTGLICRYSEDGWYEFNVSNNGTYSLLLGQWLSPEVAKYIPVIHDLSNKLTNISTSEIGLFCEDNFLQLYVNNTMIRRVEVTNYGLAEGKVGISASSFAEVPMSAIFEWIQVSEK